MEKKKKEYQEEKNQQQIDSEKNLIRQELLEKGTEKAVTT
jgi:hypothetical protein